MNTALAETVHPSKANMRGDTDVEELVEHIVRTLGVNVPFRARDLIDTAKADNPRHKFGDASFYDLLCRRAPAGADVNSYSLGIWLTAHCQRAANPPP
jgi:hypothetical protein